MTSTGLGSWDPLWAQPGDNDAEALPLWKAALIAAAVEFLVPALVFGVDWSFLHRLENHPDARDVVVSSSLRRKSIPSLRSRR
jgi:hypothetical protein